MQIVYTETINTDFTLLVSVQNVPLKYRILGNVFLEILIAY